MQVFSILLQAHSPCSIQNEAARIPLLSSSFLPPKLICTAAARQSSENSTTVFPVATLRAHLRSSTQTKTVIIPLPSLLCPHISASPVTLAVQSSVIPTTVLLHLLPTTAPLEANALAGGGVIPNALITVPIQFTILQLMQDATTACSVQKSIDISFNSFLCPEL